MKTRRFVNWAVTTNGYRLARDAAHWRDAGLTGINVSVDSLDARQFHAITGQDKFQQVMAGIDAAFDAGFAKVKVNTVLMRDVNHHQLDTFLGWIQTRPIQLRFIELMETGEGSELFRKHHISGQVLRDELLRRGWIHQLRQRSDGPAQVFCHPDYEGEIGLIMPYEKDFCATCNRLRVSSVGKLHLCLFGEGGVSLRDLLEDDGQQDALEARISLALREKKQTHFLHQNNTGITQNLSYIGG
ncbi:molybdenum cofactor biosynthesis protein A [Citrobacter amalonaticus]|nr:molybdenum cofactor biosynthesis protein A [Citrobacter amalonaticus]